MSIAAVFHQSMYCDNFRSKPNNLVKGKESTESKIISFRQTVRYENKIICRKRELGTLSNSNFTPPTADVMVAVEELKWRQRFEVKNRKVRKQKLYTPIDWPKV